MKCTSEGASLWPSVAPTMGRRWATVFIFRVGGDGAKLPGNTIIASFSFVCSDPLIAGVYYFEPIIFTMLSAAQIVCVLY